MAIETPTNIDTITTEAPEYGDWYGAVTHASLSDSVIRLRWSLNGPLTTAISVRAETRLSDLPDEPYYQPIQTIDETESSTKPQWHPVSQDTASNPPISSITVQVEPLAGWEENWLELHQIHSIPPGAPEPDYCGDFDSSIARYGPLPDHDPSSGVDDEWPEANGPGSGHLLKCACGSIRPRKTLARGRLFVSIKARSSTGPGYLTVHDYVGQIHPWLMSLKEDILEVRVVMKALLCEGPEEFTREEILERDKDEKLFVGSADPEYLNIRDEEEWMSHLPGAA